MWCKEVIQLVDISTILKEIVAKSGMEQEKFGETIGLKKAAFNNYVQGRRELPKSVITKMMEVHNINPAVFFDKDAPLYIRDINDSRKINSSNNLISVQSTSEYTYFPVHASAGPPIRIDSLTDAETITIPDAVLGRHAGDEELFFMRVNGDSMNKVIPHQSLIGVKPIQINELKDEDIIVYSDGYNYSVKRFYRDGDRLIFRPESHDASFTDYTVSEPYDDLRLHGKVVIYIVNLD